MGILSTMQSDRLLASEVLGRLTFSVCEDPRQAEHAIGVLGSAPSSFGVRSPRPAGVDARSWFLVATNDIAEVVGCARLTPWRRHSAMSRRRFWTSRPAMSLELSALGILGAEARETSYLPAAVLGLVALSVRFGMTLRARSLLTFVDEANVPAFVWLGFDRVIASIDRPGRQLLRVPLARSTRRKAGYWDFVLTGSPRQLHVPPVVPPPGLADRHGPLKARSL